MANEKRKYDPIKRREYYLRTRELKGRGKSLTRYTKKGKGSDELRRDEEARLNLERELAVLAQKLKQEKAKGNTDSPAYKQLVDRFSDTLNSYRNVYTRAGSSVIDVGERTGRGVANQGASVAKTYGRVGQSIGNHGVEVAKAYGRIGSGSAKIAADLASGKVVETNETKAGKFVSKAITKNGRRVLKTVTGF